MVRSAAVLVGEHGLVGCEKQEVCRLVDEAARRDLPVIPVLLPGVPRTAARSQAAGRAQRNGRAPAALAALRVVEPSDLLSLGEFEPAVGL